MLLVAFGSARAQEILIPSQNEDGIEINTIVIGGSGTVFLQQGNKLAINAYGNPKASYYVEDSILYLDGTGTRDVTVKRLNYLQATGAVFVRSKCGLLHGKNLSLIKTGAGKLDLMVNYENIYFCTLSTGDVSLLGECNVYCFEIKPAHSLGRLSVGNLNYKAKFEKYGDDWDLTANPNNPVGEEELQAMVTEARRFFEAETNRMWNQTDDPKDASYAGLLRRFEHFSKRNSSSDDEGNRRKRGHTPNLLFNSHWNGLEAGLNMLLSPEFTDAYLPFEGANGLELRTLRSWYLSLNIVDVGVAFDRRHSVGLFTGIGLGWNNFSWSHAVTIGVDPDTELHTLVPIDIQPDQLVESSRYSALFLQAPLMIEVKSSRSFYLDLGVTAGLRIFQWNKVKLSDGSNETDNYSGSLNKYKLDATLRMGGNHLGFFANYALLPMFDFGNLNKVHPISFGLSIDFWN